MKIEFFNLKTIPSMLPCLSKFIGPKWYWNELFKLFLFVWRQSITNNSQFINRKLNGTSADTFRTKIYIHASKTSCRKCVSQGTATTELEISMYQYLVWKCRIYLKRLMLWRYFLRFLFGSSIFRGSTLTGSKKLLNL